MVPVNAVVCACTHTRTDPHAQLTRRQTCTNTLMHMHLPMHMHTRVHALKRAHLRTHAHAHSLHALPVPPPAAANLLQGPLGHFRTF
eukprot:1148704-Pelagomonas_calceolata.AAC.2